MAVKTFSTGEVLTASDTNTYLANAGLVYITSVALSGSGVSVNNCFTSAMSNYKIIVSANAATSGGIRLRFRASGSDNSSSNYKWIYYDSNVASVGASGPTVTSGWNVPEAYITDCGAIASDTAVAMFDVFNPQRAVKTAYQGQTTLEWTGNQIYNRVISAQFNGTNQFDGFSLIATGGTGTLSGTVTIMGYRQA